MMITVASLVVLCIKIVAWVIARRTWLELRQRRAEMLESVGFLNYKALSGVCRTGYCRKNDGIKSKKWVLKNSFAIVQF